MSSLQLKARETEPRENRAPLPHVKVMTNQSHYSQGQSQAERQEYEERGRAERARHESRGGIRAVPFPRGDRSGPRCPSTSPVREAAASQMLLHIRSLKQAPL